MEKSIAPHSSTLAWKIPWTEGPGGLQSMGLQRVGHGWATSLSLSCIAEGNDNQLQCSCLENPRDGGAWWAAVYGIAQSRTWLKRLSSSRDDFAKTKLVLFAFISENKLQYHYNLLSSDLFHITHYSVAVGVEYTAPFLKEIRLTYIYHCFYSFS